MLALLPLLAVMGGPLLARQDTAPTCEIHIVLASGEPAAGARVWVQREEVGPGTEVWRERMRFEHDIEITLAELGSAFVTDAQGRVEVPRAASRRHVAAALGDVHGEGRIPADADVFTLALEEQHTLVVEVVGEDGRPVAGTPVVLLPGEARVAARQFLTDERGRARIPGLEKHWRELGPERPLHLAAGWWFDEVPEGITIAPGEIPSDPVRLVLGPHATLEVQLVDLEGCPVGGSGVVDLWAPKGTRFVSPRPFAPICDGRVLCVGVPTGLRLNVRATVRGQLSLIPAKDPVTPGLDPLEPGEHRVVEVPIGREQVHVRGRVTLTTPDGTPAPLGRLVLRGGPPSGGLQAEAESGQPFETWARIATPDDPGRGEWTIQVCGDEGLREDVLATPLGGDAPGEVDLGDLQVPLPPVLLRARVVDASGSAVPGAHVSVRSVASWWRLETDAAGVAVLRGASSLLPLDVWAEARGHAPSAFVRIESAGSDPELVLQRAGAVEGRLLLPPGIDLRWYQVRMERGDPLQPLQTARDPQRPDTFRIEDCTPGKRTVRVLGVGLSIDVPVEVVAGTTTHIDPIDLRDSLRTIEVRFAIEDGKPWTEGWFSGAYGESPPSQAYSQWKPIDASGSAKLRFAGPAIRWLRVAARGASPVTFENVENDAVLEPPTAPAVRLRMPRLDPLPPFVSLKVHGTRVDPLGVFEGSDLFGLSWEEPYAARYTGQDELLLQLPHPGTYALRWSVIRPFEVSPVELDMTLQEVTIERGTTGTVDVELSTEALARALRVAARE